jgi:hypothetical protein
MVSVGGYMHYFANARTKALYHYAACSILLDDTASLCSLHLLECCCLGHCHCPPIQYIIRYLGTRNEDGRHRAFLRFRLQTSFSDH